MTLKIFKKLYCKENTHNDYLCFDLRRNTMMNKDLFFLARELDEITNKLSESIYLENDKIEFDEIKIENISSQFEKIQLFVKNSNLEKIQTVCKGMQIFEHYIRYFNMVASMNFSLNLTASDHAITFKSILIGLLSTSVIIEYLSTDQPPEVAVFWVQNLTRSNILIDYSTFLSKEQDLALLTAGGCDLIRTIINQKTMPVYTREGKTDLDISKFKLGEIHEIAISSDETGNLIIQPFSFDFE